MRIRPIRSILHGVALVILGYGVLVAFDKASGPFVRDRSAEERFSDMLKYSDTVVDKTATARYAQRMVWLYNPRTGEWIKKVSRKDAEAILASKVYPDIAIVAQGRNDVYNFPERSVTVIADSAAKPDRLVRADGEPMEEFLFHSAKKQ